MFMLKLKKLLPKEYKFEALYLSNFKLCYNLNFTYTNECFYQCSTYKNLKFNIC